MNESIAADHPFVRSEKSNADARAFLVEQGPAATRSRSSTTSSRRRRHSGLPAPRTTFYQHGPFIDLCRGPHVESTGKIGPFKLLAVSGAYWRGDQKRPAHAARLRHGLADAGRAGPLPVAARGGQEARPPQASACSSTCSASTTSRRARRSGIPRAGRSTTRCATPCATSRSGAATRRSTRRRSSTRSCGSSRATGTCTARTCSWSRPTTRLYSLKPMNCPESTFIYRSRVRSYREFPLRLSEYGVLHRYELSGVPLGLDARAPLRTRTTPTSTSRRPRSRTEILALHGRGARVLLVVRPRAAR